MAYSQKDEEGVIVGALQARGCDQGRFLDIGAYDGKTFSNTLRLAELGWGGVCIEPSPSVFTGLIKVHRDNSSIVLVNSAISPDGGWLTFFDSNGDAVSSSNLDHVKRWGAGGVPYTPMMILSVSVAELFSKFGTSFEFINLDVEGLNWQLFVKMPWPQLVQTRVVCVEYDFRADEMVSLLQPFGFREIHRNAENLILAR